MTDHSQEAKHLLAPDWRDGTAAIAQLLEAQVHATLALVEQQRIANLIAQINGPKTYIADKSLKAALEVVANGLGIA